MMFLLTLFPATFLMGLGRDGCEPPVFQAERPAWVKECSFSLEPLPLKPSQSNVQYLLTDIQRNFIEKSIYCHNVIKAISQIGVSNIAQIEIDYSPSYEKVVMHQIRVYRDGAWSDRLQSAEHSVLQRESDLERDLYDGRYTLVYFLEDICVGDILEYSFSLEGEMPYFDSHLTNMFLFQGSAVLEHLYRRMVFDKDCKFSYKLFHCDFKPTIGDLGNNVCEWEWEFVDVPAAPDEVGAPVWYWPIARAQFSQYSSWKEVIDKVLPLYELPAAFEENPPFEIVSQVEQWMQATSNPEERAFLALRYVQEKIRYLGFEEGLEGFKPHDPYVVFHKRFGDCKDKTFLLHALLKLMGISSTPVLVSSRNGSSLPDMLPMPFAFDHIVLKIEIGKFEFWVDSTLFEQGGSSLHDNFFPGYGWGLPLAPHAHELIVTPGNFTERPAEIETWYVVNSPTEAELRVVRTFHDFQAELMRRYITWQGFQGVSDDFLHFLQRTYGSAFVSSPIAIVDDVQTNTLTITENFQIAIQTRANKKILRIFSQAIRRYLDNGLNPKRSSPYAIAYPLWVKEHIHIENPFGEWGEIGHETKHEHESLFYSHSRTIGDYSFDLRYELRHLKDHVSLDALYQYWEIVNEIEMEWMFFVDVLNRKNEAV